MYTSVKYVRILGSLILFIKDLNHSMKNWKTRWPMGYSPTGQISGWEVLIELIFSFNWTASFPFSLRNLSLRNQMDFLVNFAIIIQLAKKLVEYRRNKIAHLMPQCFAALRSCTWTVSYDNFGCSIIEKIWHALSDEPKSFGPVHVKWGWINSNEIPGDHACTRRKNH